MSQTSVEVVEPKRGLRESDRDSDRDRDRDRDTVTVPQTLDALVLNCLA
jgi:hypothetical protein